MKQQVDVALKAQNPYLKEKNSTMDLILDITPDIFNIVLNRAFWRQNYNHF